MRRYTEVAITGNLKVEYRLKDQLDILQISDTKDNELLHYSVTDVASLIRKAIAIKNLLPVSFKSN